MAIRLGLPREPQWLDLGHGVRVKCRPLTTAIFEAAKASAARQVASLFDSAEEVEEHGGEIEGLPDLATEDGRAGYSNFLFGQALARVAIMEWEGVLGEGDEPAKPTPDLINEIMSWHTLCDNFVRQYSQPFNDRIIEKKGSGLSANGTSAAGLNTATGADLQTPTAAEA